MPKLRKNQIVACTHYPGQSWKISKVHTQDKLFADCQRYDIKNDLGVILSGVRDKDLIPKTSCYFNTYISL